ncbi:hypothetical protein BCD67_22185 [Oscillatoriales cyanobacterium USR001]|nr:hypothetical protein BCD67_22185 [Oscillatoriales cyanobacterium USR001]
MFITFGSNQISIQSLANKAELVKILEGEPESLLLGEIAEHNLEFYLAKVQFQSSDSEPFCIGICSEGHGLKPHVLIQPERDLILFGYNQEVTGVNINNRQIAFKIPLNSLFYYFLHLKERGIILIVQEVDVTAITESGKELWRYGKDLITQTAVEGEKLYLNFMDESPTCLNIVSGELVSA